MGIEVDRTGKWWNDWWYYYPMYWIFFTHLIGASLLTNLWKIPCSIFWRWLVDWLLCCDLDELIYWALLRLGNRVQPTSILWDGIGVFLESGLRWGVELWKVWFYKVLHHYAWVGVVMRWSCYISNRIFQITVYIILQEMCFHQWFWCLEWILHYIVVYIYYHMYIYIHTIDIFCFFH